jgi:hypothetical protein
MPGLPGAKHLAAEGEVLLNNYPRTVQPYQSIERFLSKEKAIPFLIEPGLVPLVKALALDVRGRKLLVTRKPAPRESDRGAVGYLPGFGVRLLLATGPETTLTWECLYGVL